MPELGRSLCVCVIKRYKMVDLDEDILNDVFDTLSDWESHIRSTGLHDHPLLRGPKP